LKRTSTWWTVLALCVASTVLQGQDIHFAQYYNSTLNLNPALTGVFSSDYRFTGNYRSQWESVPVPYMTFSGAFEQKFYSEALENSYFSGGFLFNYDQAGDSKLSLTNLGVSGSYSLQMSETMFMTAGAHLGIAQRAFRTGDLTFDSQFDGEQFNPNLPKESFDDTSLLGLDISSGLNVRLQPEDADPLEKRSKLDFGGAVFHINQPNQSFNDDDKIQLFRRYSFYALGTLMLSNSFDVVLMGTSQFQGSYQENVVGGGGRIFIVKQKAKELAVQLGASYRFGDFGDAVIPHFEVLIKQWKVGVSYDVNTSELQIATDRRGGPEISVQYIINKIKPLEVMKICPII